MKRFKISQKRTGREHSGLLLFLTCGCHVILVLLRLNTSDNCLATYNCWDKWWPFCVDKCFSLLWKIIWLEGAIHPWKVSLYFFTSPVFDVHCLHVLPWHSSHRAEHPIFRKLNTWQSLINPEDCLTTLTAVFSRILKDSCNLLGEKIFRLLFDNKDFWLIFLKSRLSLAAATSRWNCTDIQCHQKKNFTHLGDDLIFPQAPPVGWIFFSCLDNYWMDWMTFCADIQGFLTKQN